MDSSETCYQCEDCPRLFKSLGLYNQHRKKHTKPYPCETCGESFGLRTDMRRHVQARHRLGQKMHPCSIDGCGFKATRKDNIRQHLRKSHKNIPLAPAKPPGKRRRITRAQAPLSEEAKPFDVSSTLMQAASMGNVPLAEMMMKHGAQLSIQAADGSTALHCAVKANKTHMTQFLLEAGAPLETRNGKNATPLHEAIEESNQDAFNMLLERGAVVSEVELEKVIKKGDLTLFRAMIVHLGEHWINKWGQVMVQIASRFEQVPILQTVLSHPEVNQEWVAKLTPEFWSNAIIPVPIFTCLVASGKLNPNTELGWRKRSLLQLAVAEGKVEIMEILLNHPDIEVNNLDRWGFTALHIAAANGRIELVKTLLQHTKIMADAHGNNHRGIEPTPLHISAQRGHVEVVKVLMGRFDVMVNRTNRQGRTPLLIAIRSGKSDVVDYMLRSAEIDVTIQDHKRKTMLTVAIERGHIDMVGLLLKHPRVDLSIPSHQIHTLLRNAIWSVQWSTVRFLLEYNNELGIWKSDDMVLVSNKDSTDEEIWDMLLNAHIPLFNGTDRKIELLLHAVAKHGNIPMLSCLLQSDQIDINLRSRTGWTALHLSARKGHTECVELLLQDRRVNVNACSCGRKSTDYRGCSGTPLSQAANGGHLKVVELLLNDGRLDTNHICNETALHEAVVGDHVKVVELLVQDGRMDINAYRKSGPSWYNHRRTALDVAKMYRRNGIERILLSHGAKSQDEVEGKGQFNFQVIVQDEHNPDGMQDDSWMPDDSWMQDDGWMQDKCNYELGLEAVPFSTSEHEGAAEIMGEEEEEEDWDFFGNMGD